MTKIQNIEFFFSLLRAGLFSGQGLQLTVNISKVDWSEVYRLAEEQSVIGIVAKGIDRLKSHDSKYKCPQEWALQFIGQTLQIEQQNKAMNEFVAGLIEKLRKSDIYALLVKGQGVAQCYEKPLWRSCGDVDLFLSTDNYEKAKEVLTPIASSVENEYKTSKHLGMTINGWVVELHGTLQCNLSRSVKRGIVEIENDIIYGGQVRSWQNGRVQVFLPSADDDAIYIFAHFLNHFYKEGVGLRQICDWCRLLWTYRESLNRGLLESRIRKMGLMSEWKAFAALAVDWLGMPKDAMPMYDESPRWSKKVCRIIDFIMMSGNMGHNRDMSHFSNKPFFVRKCISASRRIEDLMNHARIFPLDSLRFSFTIMKNGVKSAGRGEG